MKKTILSIALSLSMAMMISCGGEKPAETTEPVTEQAAVINTTHAYVCPMNCENSASDKPGVCAVCGMDLIKNPNYKGAVDSTSSQTQVSAGDSTAVSSGAETKDDHEGHDH